MYANIYRAIFQDNKDRFTIGDGPVEINSAYRDRLAEEFREYNSHIDRLLSGTASTYCYSDPEERSILFLIHNHCGYDAGKAIFDKRYYERETFRFYLYSEDGKHEYVDDIDTDVDVDEEFRGLDHLSAVGINDILTNKYTSYGAFFMGYGLLPMTQLLFLTPPFSKSFVGKLQPLTEAIDSSPYFYP